MATETTKYHFSKPAETDYYDVNVQNNNWDVADQTLKGLDDEKVDKNGGDIANTEVSEFAASSTEWPVPAAGEAPKTLWGKTKKFFEDFKNWMTGVCLLGQLVSNNTTNNANLPASAAAVYQEAQLRAQQFAQLNSDKAGVDHNHNGVYLSVWSSRINAVSFNSTINAPVMYIDNTEYPIVKGPQGGNYTVRTLSITTNPNTEKKSMLVEWYADGRIYRNYCDLTV